MSKKAKRGLLAIDLDPEIEEYDEFAEEVKRADTLTRQQRRERRLLTATILLATFIILAVVGIITVLFILDPIEVADVMESKGAVDIAEILRQAAEVLNGK